MKQVSINTSQTCEVFINGERFTMPNESGLNDALSEFGAIKPYAILINNQFIPASKHDNVIINNKDHIEIISAIQGG